MATKAQKGLKAKIEKADLNPSKIVCKKDGTVEVFWGYFYRHGRSVETYSEKVKEALPDVKIVGGRDEFRAWPKDSYLVVVLSTDGSEEDGSQG